MTLTLTRARSAQAWNAALAGHSGVTPFHGWDWLRTHCELQGWRFEPLIVERDGQALGVIPLLLARKGPLWIAGQAPFPYAGPIIETADLALALKAVSRWSTPRRIMLNRFDLHLPTDEQLATLKTVGAGIEVGRTWLLDLSHRDPARLYAGYNRNTKKALRIAERVGIETRQATLEDAATLLPRLLNEAYGAHGVANPYPYDEAGWKAVCAGMYLAGAYQAGRCVGILAVPAKADTAFDWVGGCLREVRDTRANFALHVHVFDWAMAQGYDTYDLVAEADEKIGAFKAGFGAEANRWALATLPPWPWKIVYRVRQALQRRG
jgi:hypothetical protein